MVVVVVVATAQCVTLSGTESKVQGFTNLAFKLFWKHVLKIWLAYQNEYSNTWNGGVPDNTLALNFATGGFLPDSIWINQLSSFLKSSLGRKKFIW